MILIDTHVLVWARARPERLSAPARAVIDDAEEIAVSAISLWELAMLIDRGRVTVDATVEVYLAQVSSSVTVLPITAGVAGRVTRLPEGFPGDPADRLIYATALVHGLPFVSADRAMRAVDPAIIW